jgi:hypothetical protein
MERQEISGMNALLSRVEITPRYCSLYDKHVLANWISLIADVRGLDAAAIASLSGLDTRTAQSILDSCVIDLSVQTLDDVLRVVEQRPACGTHMRPGVLRPAHAETDGVAA